MLPHYSSQASTTTREKGKGARQHQGRRRGGEEKEKEPKLAKTNSKHTFNL